MHQEQEYDYVLVVFHQLAGSYEPFSIKLFSFLVALGWSIVVSVIHMSPKNLRFHLYHFHLKSYESFPVL